VPGAPLGSMRTGIVIFWPAFTSRGSKAAFRFVLLRHKSPVGELIVVSNGAVSARIEICARTGFVGFLPSGPTRYGPIPHSPPGICGADNVAVEVLPGVETTSGSPKAQDRSKKLRTGAVTLADKRVVCDGTR